MGAIKQAAIEEDERKRAWCPGCDAPKADSCDSCGEPACSLCEFNCGITLCAECRECLEAE